MEFPFVGGREKVEPDEIVYIETDRHRNVFYLKGNREYAIYRKLDDIEKELEAYGFLRVHRSFLVNMRYVARIKNYLMSLTDGTLISIPRARYRAVKTAVEQFNQNGGE